MTDTAVNTDYLAGAFVEGRDLAAALKRETRRVAAAWRHRQIDAAVLEVLSELLARTAQALNDSSLTATELAPAWESLSTPPEVVQWLEAALATPRTSLEVAALAVHLIDIAEDMALAVFVPELPSLATKSDRTGDAARNVGVARYLRG